MKKWKRLASFLLAICLLCTIVPHALASTSGGGKNWKLCGENQ